jgi:bla regulator protein blaR1
LIHFTWQGTLVALSLAGVLRVLRGASSNTRYAAACVALMLMSSSPLFTIAIIGHSTRDKTASRLPPQFVAQPASQPQPVEIEPTIVPTHADFALASPRPWLFNRPAPIRPLLPWMMLLWLLGVVFFSVRLMGGWLYTQRLKSYGTRALEEE